MSEQDNFPVGDADQPRDMTPEELEEALRWLEELAGRQGKSLDGLLTLDDTPLEDSPFKGLFDSDEQELPGWLREVPSAEDSIDEVVEGESRLDWLARMSGRESVEELPTLEWRRMTEGEEEDDGDLVDAMPEAAAAIAGLPDVSDDKPPAVVDEMITLAMAEKVLTPEVTESESAVTEPAELSDSPPPAVLLAFAETPPIDHVSPVPTAAEIAPLDTPSDTLADDALLDAERLVMGPDDLDEAMAWLEELAASQEAPIEDLPSVADRALASKLIAEAASSLSSIEGPDSSQIGIAMSGIYIGKTRLAPTGPLVGEPPADETPDSAIFAEAALATETDGSDEIVPTALLVGSELSDPVDESPAEELELAESISDEPNLSEVVITEAVTDEIAFEEIAEAFIVTEVITRTIVEEPVAEVSAYEEPTAITQMNGSSRTLPELLTVVDQLAIPNNTSLDEIGAMLAADPVLVKITPFSLESTLDWLEGGSEVGKSADPLDASLVAAMPDDPDEAQAWLEQMSGVDVVEEASTKGYFSADSVAQSGANAPNIDLTEADLLDMPEDPDAAIAWIESLAARREGS